MYPAGVDTIWAVMSKDDERFVGHASVRPRPVKPEDWEISYYLVKVEWGKGYATELAQRLSTYAFEILALPAVYATVVPQNTFSIGVLRKAGFSFHSEESDEVGPYFVYALSQKAFRTINPSS
jgi:RimJ/RimL family protein N-acetyltransferase